VCSSDLAIAVGVGSIARHYVSKQTEELKEQLNKIMYALYNDGKTGLINKVDQLIENQQCIRVDVEVLKSKAEQ
jgi:hypothetical protein